MAEFFNLPEYYIYKQIIKFAPHNAFQNTTTSSLNTQPEIRMMPRRRLSGNQILLVEPVDKRGANQQNNHSS